MRCCEHYSPDSNDMQRHDGLRMAEKYLFDKPLNQAACTNPELIGNMPFGGCPYARNMNKCNFYSPEDLKTVKAVAVSRKEQAGVVELRIETARATYGTVEFYVVKIEGDTREVLHTVNAHEHSEKTQIRTLELFEHELDQLGEEKEVTEIDTQENTDEFSYLLEVTNGIRATA